MKHVTAFVALTLALSVILSGAHAKDLAALPGTDLTQKNTTTEDQPIKVGGDLHNHTDKAGKSLIKAIGDSLQADNRSLRLRGKKQSLRITLAGVFNTGLALGIH